MVPLVKKTVSVPNQVVKELIAEWLNLNTEGTEWVPEDVAINKDDMDFPGIVTFKAESYK